MKQVHEKENSLFNRREMTFELEAEIPPSIEEAGKLVSEKTKVPVENIKVKKVEGSFWKKEFKIHCFAYTTKEDKEKMDVKTRKQRKSEKAQAKNTEGKTN